MISVYWKGFIRINQKNVVFFEQSFDCMVNIQNKARRSNSLILNPIDIFFNSYLSKDYHEHEKVVVSQQITDLNIFKGVLTGAALRKNTTYWLIMLYSFLIYFNEL